MTSKKVYVLTVEHNDYNQHGAYFICVFKDKPLPSGLLLQTKGLSLDDCQKLIDNTLFDIEQHETYFLELTDLL